VKRASSLRGGSGGSVEGGLGEEDHRRFDEPGFGWESTVEGGRIELSKGSDEKGDREKRPEEESCESSVVSTFSVVASVRSPNEPSGSTASIVALRSGRGRIGEWVEVGGGVKSTHASSARRRGG